MTKKRNMFVAAIFALAIGSAFTTKVESAKFLGPFQKTTSGCPSITSPCTLSSGVACTNIYLDSHCTLAAFRP